MEIVNKERFEEIIKNNKFVLVDFYADWCGPCKMVTPVLEKFSELNKDRIVVVKVNVDNEETLAYQFRISSIPTLLFFKDGKPVRQEIGYRTIDQLNQILENGLN